MLKNIWCFICYILAMSSFIFNGFFTGFKVLVAIAIIMAIVERISEEIFPHQWR